MPIFEISNIVDDDFPEVKLKLVSFTVYLISGLLIAYSLHTTTGLVVNEGSDPGVGQDVSEIMWNLIPEERDWYHTEESPLDSAAHVKAQIIGNSILLGIKDNKLVLGTWQRVYFIEYIEAREREVFVSILGVI